MQCSHKCSLISFYFYSNSINANPDTIIVVTFSKLFKIIYIFMVFRRWQSFKRIRGAQNFRGTYGGQSNGAQHVSKPLEA